MSIQREPKEKLTGLLENPYREEDALASLFLLERLTADKRFGAFIPTLRTSEVSLVITHPTINGQIILTPYSDEKFLVEAERIPFNYKDNVGPVGTFSKVIKMEDSLLVLIQEATRRLNA